MQKRLSLVFGYVLLAAGARVAAHDLWIEPTSFVPEAGKVVGIRLRVGQDLIGDPVPRDPSLIDQFIVAGPDGRVPVTGRDGADPAGLMRATVPGLHVIGYRSRPSSVTMPAAKFNEYLREEGLDHIVDARAARGQTNTDAREQFSRCAKSLMIAGPGADAQGDRVLGFTLELVAEKNPYTLARDADLPVKILYDHRPLPKALIVAINRTNPEAKVMARSDKDGRVRLRLSRPGLWLVKAVHMVPAVSGSGADWQSYWASLTFETRNAVAQARVQ